MFLPLIYCFITYYIARILVVVSHSPGAAALNNLKMIFNQFLFLLALSC